MEQISIPGWDIDTSSLLDAAGDVVQGGIAVIWSIITANPVLAAVAGFSLLVLAFRALGKAKHASRF